MPNVQVLLPGVEDLLAFFEGLKNLDLLPIANELAEQMYAENVQARVEGVSGSGLDLTEIKESTIERRRRAGKGSGPPLAPDDTASQIVAAFETRVEHPSPHEWYVIGEWNLPWLQYHITGTKWMPARNPVGFRPSFTAKANEIFALRVSELLAGRR
jgi:hypothetical protein